MSLLKRGGAITAGALMLGSLVACSGGAESPAPPPKPQDSGTAISNPKNASGVDLCRMLPQEGASAIGVDPTGAIDDTPKISDDIPDTCVWKSPDGHTSVALGVIPERSIDEYYANKSTYSDYQELTIAGYPAVRANDADPAQSGSCSIFLAAADRQVIYADTAQVDITDPCAVTQKALESAVPTLPAAK
ncbi:DUF3558 family protein [Saccharopolyspora griseoalba]|uniref:DUF3558 family protein n=1 Tax=Saccharopolyspora griseoalba TaxID=1431848 RepID=A0ABW2LDY0_9PSEU